MGEGQMLAEPLSYADAMRIARGCTDYGGGYRGTDHYEAYQHGIGTVIAALEKGAALGLSDTQTRALHEIGAVPAAAEERCTTDTLAYRLERAAKVRANKALREGYVCARCSGRPWPTPEEVERCGASIDELFGASKRALDEYAAKKGITFIGRDEVSDLPRGDAAPNEAAAAGIAAESRGAAGPEHPAEKCAAHGERWIEGTTCPTCGGRRFWHSGLGVTTTDEHQICLGSCGMNRCVDGIDS